MGIENTHEAADQSPKPEHAPHKPVTISEQQQKAAEQEAQQAAEEADVMMDAFTEAANVRIPSQGKISFYGTPQDGFGYHKDKLLTASGKRFNPSELVAAHKTLPFGTRVEVTNPKTGQKVNVTIIDRGPYYGDRVFDLSYGAFLKIAKKDDGVINAKFRILSLPRAA